MTTYSAICELTDYKVDHDMEISDETIDKVINALQEVERLKKAIESAKAEINSLKGNNFPNSYYVKIIDKYIKGVSA